MSTQEWLKTQWWIAVGRWLAVVVGLYLTAAIRNQPPMQPGPISRPALLAMTLVLAAYNLVAQFGLPRLAERSRAAAERLVGAFVIGDFLICSGWVLLLSNNHFNTGFALFCVIAIEVAVNYPRRWLVTVVFLAGYLGILLCSRAIGLHYNFTIHSDELTFRFFIVLIVSLLTTAITKDRENVRELAEQRSLTDPLTGLGNRRALDMRLAEEIVRAGRFAYPLTVLLLDVDHFKHYNDTYGHRAGDEILRSIGRVLRSQVLRQGTDHAYRYGGEEFLVLLPGTQGTDALEVAERLRAAIHAESASIRPPHGPTAVTASAGLAVYPTDASTGDDVVQRADLALYCAKKTRNRAVAFGSEAMETAPATPQRGPRAVAG
jgi:diguanylate cyclase (GGDEF)-like protein